MLKYCWLDYVINRTAKNARQRFTPPINVADEVAWRKMTTANDMQTHTRTTFSTCSRCLLEKTFIKISARRAVIREIADRAVNFQGAIFYLHFRWSARCGDERETPPRSPSQRQSRNCISRAEIKPQPPRLVVLGRRDKKRNPHTAAVTLKSHIDARECVKNSISNAPPSNKVNPLSPRSPLCVCESGFSNFARERRGAENDGKIHLPRKNALNR